MAPIFCWSAVKFDKLLEFREDLHWLTIVNQILHHSWESVWCHDGNVTVFNFTLHFKQQRKIWLNSGTFTKSLKIFESYAIQTASFCAIWDSCLSLAEECSCQFCSLFSVRYYLVLLLFSIIRYYVSSI